MAFIALFPHRSTYPRTSCITCKTTATLSESSKPLKAITPQNLHKTTIYYLLTCAVPYLPQAAHPNDNDVLTLAFSIDDPNWLRTRYIRSKPFILESRSGKRIYRGVHGTPGITGINAPTKPKNTPKGIFVFRKWLIAHGSRLPWRLSPRDLVTFGETALGNVLTEAELIDVRGTELRHVCKYDHTHWLLTVAKNPTGKVLRSFVCECRDTTRRVCTIDDFDGQQIAVAGEFIVVLGWKTANLGGFGGLMKGLFGGSENRSFIDIDTGTTVLVIDKAGEIVLRSRVDGLLTSILARETNDRLRILAKRVLGKQVDLTTLEDIRSGRSFSASQDIKSTIVHFDIDDKIGEIRDIGHADVEVMDFVKTCDAKNCGDVYVGYNRSANRVGLWDLQGKCWETERGTLSGALYNSEHSHISVLFTDSESEPKILFFEADNIRNGPISEVTLDGLQGINASIDGVWTDLEFEWSEDNAKIVKSAYELFAEKEWNDIESGFSSLGI